MTEWRKKESQEVKAVFRIGFRNEKVLQEKKRIWDSTNRAGTSRGAAKQARGQKGAKGKRGRDSSY